MTIFSDSEDELLVLEADTGPAALILPNGRAAHAVAPRAHSPCSSQGQAPSFACTVVPEAVALSDSEEDEELLIRLELKYGIVSQQPVRFR